MFGPPGSLRLIMKDGLSGRESSVPGFESWLFLQDGESSHYPLKVTVDV
jgi:hypothetical protein